MNCPNCGSAVEAGAKFCSVCGTKLIEDTPAVSVRPAAPEIEIPQPKAPEKKEIELVLPGHEMYEEMEEEEDLSDILSPNKGVETHGNMQAQTEPQIELVLPSESPQQMQARLELERELKERRKKQEQEELRRKAEAEEQRKKQEQEDLKKQEIQDEMKRRELRKQREAEMSGTARKAERPAATQQVAPANPEGLWGILAYFSWIGLIAAFFKEKSTNSQFMKTHVNNSFYLQLLSFLSAWTGWFTFPVFMIVFVFSIIGIFGAVKGEETQLPIISQLPQIL